MLTSGTMCSCPLKCFASLLRTKILHFFMSKKCEKILNVLNHISLILIYYILIVLDHEPFGPWPCFIDWATHIWEQSDPYPWFPSAISSRDSLGMETAREWAAHPHLRRPTAGSSHQQSEHVILNCHAELVCQIFRQIPHPFSKALWCTVLLYKEVVRRLVHIISFRKNKSLWCSTVFIDPLSMSPRPPPRIPNHYIFTIIWAKGCYFHLQRWV